MGAKSGFGILTLSSVCPILSVLISGFLPCCKGKVQPDDALSGGQVNSIGTQYSPVPDDKDEDSPSPPASPPGSARSSQPKLEARP